LTLDQRVATADAVISALRQLGKQWCFQGEMGEHGYLHWQCRFSLFHKKVRGGVLSLLDALKLKGVVNPETGQELQCSLTETTVEVHKKIKESRLNFYCLKIDSRVSGPWTDKDPEPKFESNEVKLLEEKGLHPWQKSVLADIEGEYDPRTINCVIQPPGSVGKSSFTEWLEYKDHAYEVPPFRLMEDIMACVMSQKRYNAYTFDMPRGMANSKLGDFFSGMECLKNGLSYDKRYHFKKRRQNRPKIWMFTNTMPKLGLLSPDRWAFWTVTPDLKLIKYVAPVIKKRKLDIDEDLFE
jgi:hypothetical protein